MLISFSRDFRKLGNVVFIVCQIRLQESFAEIPSASQFRVSSCLLYNN